MNFIFGWMGFDFYKKYVVMVKAHNYPEYYKDVLIYYQLPNDSEEHIEEAWLAVNENNEYLWTLSDNEQIIPDEWVTHWEYIK